MLQLALPAVVAERLNAAAKLLMNSDSIPLFVIGIDENNNISLINTDQQVGKEFTISILQTLLKEAQKEKDSGIQTPGRIITLHH